MAFESETLLLRIEAVGAETDEDDGLSDTVMRLDAALSGMRPTCESQRQGAAIYPSFEDLVDRHRAFAASRQLTASSRKIDHRARRAMGHHRSAARELAPTHPEMT